MTNKTTALVVVLVVALALVGVFTWSKTSPADNAGENATSTSESATSTATTTAPKAGATGGTSGAAKPSGSTTAPKPTYPGTMTLSLNQTGYVGDVGITPLVVLEDSRCPAGVQCVQAGTVLVSARMNSAKSDYSTRFSIGNPTPIVGGFVVTLTNVTPAAIAGGKPASDTYRFTFRVAEDN